MRNDATSTLVTALVLTMLLTIIKFLPWSLQSLILRRDEDRLADNDEVN